VGIGADIILDASLFFNDMQVSAPNAKATAFTIPIARQHSIPNASPNGLRASPGQHSSFRHIYFLIAPLLFSAHYREQHGKSDVRGVNRPVLQQDAHVIHRRAGQLD
jgi:hypothetical protein